MATPRVLILRAPGTNCDIETAHAFDVAGGQSERVHVGRLIENPALHQRYQILCIPGGFSYGDDIAAGRILATRMHHHLDEMIHHFVDSGDNLVLGICNGMQVLMRLGVLTSGIPAAQPAMAGGGEEAPSHDVPPATLTWNNHGRFEDRWVNLAVDKTPCVFLKDIEQMYLPMAHAEGKFVARDEAAMDQLRSEGRLAIRYCDESGAIKNETLPFPVNPNGGDANVAGVCDASGRVFGLMPHPERHIDATQHPFWTRRKVQPEHGDGLQMFRNAVEWFA
ncbi:phosphoribosylformylglycinamidine synthase subunit I [Neorhodopirellula lusitana]|uniref:Phosphoribosylformylglycinamidine synthase subunit I n=1 Tax=Neorhodopirellula lusitana TaxID=445327 RepID=A0ABY1PQJ0_9BACT|nr:phosphoribosylformylglycinamidine synthase I [Neorhodopirellula lusitana]SMP40827.1 phosphoribosylformylglycinamidine synthase subunit I [Neorhodopirellula lusitana]